MDVGPEPVEDAAHDRIGFRVDARAVERLIAVVDPQEPGAEFEGLGAEARHVLQRVAIAERPVRLAMDDDRLRERLADARNASEQLRRGGVDVDAHRVDAVLDHRVERAAELLLGEVVLVLADADRLRDRS